MELLPCPFCGSSNLDFAQGSTYRWMSVVCNDCGASSGETRKSILGGEFTSDDKRWAIAEWNRRAIPASVPEGWKLVPMKADIDMQNAGGAHLTGITSYAYPTALKVYAAMLSAAPAPPVSEDRKDAERYRVLKSGDFSVEQFVSSSYGWKFVPMEELDAAIDAAMQEDKR